jgi:hypothetical protein
MRGLPFPRWYPQSGKRPQIVPPGTILLDRQYDIADRHRIGSAIVIPLTYPPSNRLTYRGQLGYNTGSLRPSVDVGHARRRDRSRSARTSVRKDVEWVNS